MSEKTVAAVYADGVLRLHEPLPIPNNTPVKVTVEATNLSDFDPVLEIVGVYHSQRPLIDGIPVSEDPDLYLLAEALGEEADGLHAWEIAPRRYRRGKNNKPVRLLGNH